MIGSRNEQLFTANRLLEKDIEKITLDLEMCLLRASDKNPEEGLKDLQKSLETKTKTLNQKMKAIEKEVKPNLTKKQSRAFGLIRTKTNMTAEEITDYGEASRNLRVQIQPGYLIKILITTAFLKKGGWDKIFTPPFLGFIKSVYTF
jgi:hypothetical protein